MATPLAAEPPPLAEPVASARPRRWPWWVAASVLGAALLWPEHVRIHFANGLREDIEVTTDGARWQRVPAGATADVPVSRWETTEVRWRTVARAGDTMDRIAGGERVYPAKLGLRTELTWRTSPVRADGAHVLHITATNAAASARRLRIESTGRPGHACEASVPPGARAVPVGYCLVEGVVRASVAGGRAATRPVALLDVAARPPGVPLSALVDLDSLRTGQ